MDSQPTPHIIGNASNKASYSAAKGISVEDKDMQFFNVHEIDNGEEKIKTQRYILNTHN